MKQMRDRNNSRQRSLTVEAGGLEDNGDFIHLLKYELEPIALDPSSSKERTHRSAHVIIMSTSKKPNPFLAMSAGCIAGKLVLFIHAFVCEDAT